MTSSPSDSIESWMREAKKAVDSPRPRRTDGIVPSLWQAQSNWSEYDIGSEKDLRNWLRHAAALTGAFYRGRKAQVAVAGDFDTGKHRRNVVAAQAAIRKVLAAGPIGLPGNDEPDPARQAKEDGYEADARHSRLTEALTDLAVLERASPETRKMSLDRVLRDAVASICGPLSIIDDDELRLDALEHAWLDAGLPDRSSRNGEKFRTWLHNYLITNQLFRKNPRKIRGKA